MIIGTWVDIDAPEHIWIISSDTVKTEGQCWIYKVKIEQPRNNKKIKGQYWFGFSYHNCNEQSIAYFGNISIDSIYMKCYDSTQDTSLTNSETFVFKRKSK
jgi:hypothetical protein